PLIPSPMSLSLLRHHFPATNNCQLHKYARKHSLPFFFLGTGAFAFSHTFEITKLFKKHFSSQKPTAVAATIEQLCSRSAYLFFLPREETLKLKFLINFLMAHSHTRATGMKPSRIYIN